VEWASGGTLFLKELGGVGHDFQARLLRVLKDSEMSRVGDACAIRTDVRVLAATASDLSLRVRADHFLPDLYDRLNAVIIDLPPLRERKEDLPLLVDHFVRKFNGHTNKAVDGASPEVLARLRDYDWPGNVRELRSVVQEAVILCATTTLQPEDLPTAFGRMPPAWMVSAAPLAHR
jgi:DNA-binding NtrC family response regulator